MSLSESLTTVIVAEREREIERRNRSWRLLHPEPEEKPARTAEPGLPTRIHAGRRAAAGSACEPS